MNNKSEAAHDEQVEAQKDELYDKLIEQTQELSLAELEELIEVAIKYKNEKRGG